MSASKKTARAAVRSIRARAARPSKAAATRERFPAIEAFTAGYLNQDVYDIYGSPAKAVEAFLADAGPDDIRALRQEWRAFQAALPRGSRSQSPSITLT